MPRSWRTSPLEGDDSSENIRMRQRYRWAICVLAIALLLGTIVEAGTKAAKPPPTAKTPVEQFMLKVRELDPQG